MQLISVSVGAYTPEGIARLAKVIRATLKVRGWHERELCRAIKSRAVQLGRPELSLSTGTVNRYASVPPVVKRPQADVLEAIAPFIYRVVAIHGDDVQVDASQTYTDWREFARIATDAYCHSAKKPIQSEGQDGNNGGSTKRKGLKMNIGGNGQGAVGQLIRSEMESRGLDPEKSEDLNQFLRFFPSDLEADRDYVTQVILGSIEYVSDTYIAAIAFNIRAFTGNEEYSTDYLIELNRRRNGSGSKRITH